MNDEYKTYVLVSAPMFNRLKISGHLTDVSDEGQLHVALYFKMPVVLMPKAKLPDHVDMLVGDYDYVKTIVDPWLKEKQS